MITIEDVAKKAGVSKSSVSRVLNKRFEYMSEEMKEKVLNAIDELNYTPNSLAQSLKTKKSKVIGIVLSDIANPLWAEVLNGVQEKCMGRGYGLMVSSSNEDPAIERTNIEVLRNKYVDGIIVNTTGGNRDVFEDLLSSDYPFAFLDRSFNDMKVDTVAVDNNLGIRKAFEYLVKQGHRKIGIILYPLKNKSPRIERLEAYKQVSQEYGIEIDTSYIKVCDQQKGNGIKATSELLSLDNRPTAILSTHTFLNLEILAGVKQFGLKVPKDISVVGYDDFPWTSFLDPALTTIAQPAFDMGAKIATLLIDEVERNKKENHKVIKMKPQLIIRQSCAPMGVDEKL